MNALQVAMVRRAGFYLLAAIALAASVYYVAIPRTDWARFASFQEMAENLLRFFPPNLNAIPGLLKATLDTMLMAFLATVVIGAVVPVIVWLAARNVTPHFLTYFIGRAIIIVSRSVHELIWALLFVVAVGLGPLAGILALATRGIGFVSKVVAEEVEAIDPKPIEAIRATGASPVNVLILAVVPQILPIYLGTLIFQWEIDLRRAAVIGVVGGGGLGLAFHQAMIQFQWHDATAIVVILVIIVALGEVISRKLRKRII